MRFLQVPKSDAQVTKQLLLSHRAIDHDHAIEHDEAYVYFPLVGVADVEGLAYTIVERKATTRSPQRDLKSALAEKLSAEELEHLKTAYDLVGDIAIIEVDERLAQRAELIGTTLMELFPNIKTVVQRGKHEGEFRTQQLRHLAGERRTETIHTENGVRLALDVEKVYFSARLATERLRIAKLVEADERVLVMFSGCAPYPCVIAKHAKAQEIIGIEHNPAGHTYAERNVRMNKITNVALRCADVREAVPTLEGSFDRIVMPLPKQAERFLDIALPAALQDGTIHLYQFCREEEIAQRGSAIIAEVGRLGYHAKIINTILCGQHAPGTYRVCFDLRVA